MKKFTLNDYLNVLYALAIFTILINIVGCASKRTQCDGLSGSKATDCHEAIKAKEAHEKLIKAGF